MSVQLTELIVDVDLRPAESCDAAYLLRLEETCMRGYAEALWGSWDQTTTVETFDVANHYLIKRDGVVVGCVAETWHSDHLFIDELYVDTPFERQGIGAVVLRMKTQEAALRGLSTKLSVLTTNPADAFYRREGFEIESETNERRRMSKAANGSSNHSVTRNRRDSFADPQTVHLSLNSHEAVQRHGPIRPGEA